MKNDYGIIVQLTSNTALKARKHLQAAGYQIFFKITETQFFV